jgi:quercetin dioxygenase-like cupin family protein
MAKYVLRLFDDRLGTKASPTRPLPAENRVIYVADGMATVTAGGTSATLSANSALFSAGETTIVGGAEGAQLLRYELVGVPESEHGMLTGDNVSSELLLDAAMDLEPGDGYLMRCDRVDIPPTGIAYTHTHQGGGIRCLLRGGFTVQTKGHTHRIGPGEPWYEAGPDPVLAWAPDDRPGHFSRVMILPRTLTGKSSIRYVKPEDAEKPKLQRYTIFIDALIAI